MANDVGTALEWANAAAQMSSEAIEGWTNLANEKKQRQWSEKMMAEQNLWNLEQWQRENEYNSPSAQVDRLRAAGLNPLYYGIDGVPAAHLESAQPLGYERAGGFRSVINPFGSVIDTKAKLAQIENIRANTAKTNNENVSETVRREQMIADIDNAKQYLNNLKTQQGLDESRKKEIDKAISWMDRINESVVSKNEASSKLDEAQRNRINRLVDGEVLYQAKSIEDFDLKWQKIEAEIDKIVAETGLLKEDVVNYALNHAQAGFLGTGLSFPNFIRSLAEGKKRFDEFTGSLDGAKSGTR